MKLPFFLVCFPLLLLAQPKGQHNLVSNRLPAQWQEGLPLGNGLIGCLIWEKEGRLRLALDRADLWDLRPMNGLDRPEFNYKWVAEQVQAGNYQQVQEYFDAPYEREPGPTKLPGGAIEFAVPASPVASELDISNGLAIVQWADGKKFESFVHASAREGWFRFTGFTDIRSMFRLIPPAYSASQEAGNANSVQGSDLARLGYIQSEAFERRGVWLFHQPGWGGFSYEIAVCLRKKGRDVWEGVWSISSHFTQKIDVERAEQTVRKAISRGFDKSLQASAEWWKDYWSKSSISLPDDPLIERQYYLDMYKFGCVARENSPMISLQAVWTADNGRLPPWKGDLHHDLNTQMSYWPAYTSNHLPEAMSYLKHLESNEAAHRAYTKRYFGTDGLNVPGVSTLLGEAMGGWIQYSCSPTVAAWCAQHFYLQWQYSRDRRLLEEHAWPWLRDVARHLEELTFIDFRDRRVLPLSSSPEINDNSIKAWFPNTLSNYDLALIRFVFEKTAELADEMQLMEESSKWRRMVDELPPFSLDAGGSLMFAPTLPYRESHRHFSHLMAIHPLGLLDWDNPKERPIIQRSLQVLDSIGPSAWCGYSYAWQASLRARARDGEGAREALRIFAEAFVSKNSFHLNGDQSGKGYSSFTYDPFTLEGNFAFAAGVQEMLLQSQGGVLRVFPALPGKWRQASFRDFRAEGGFVVSATYKKRIEVLATVDGPLTLALPGGKWIWKMKDVSGSLGGPGGGVWKGPMKKGERIVFDVEGN